MKSYWNEILAAVAAQLSSIQGLPPVQRRKRSLQWPAVGIKRVVGLWAVSDEYGPNKTFIGSDGRRVVTILYTIGISILIQADEVFESDAEDPDFLTLEWREQIRQLFDRPAGNDAAPALPGAPTVYQTDVDLGPVYDEGALNRAYNESRLTLICESWEPATGPT